MTAAKWATFNLKIVALTIHVFKFNLFKGGSACKCEMAEAANY